MNEPDPTVGPRPSSRTSEELAALAARVGRMESILMAAAASLAALCLILGELLPYLTFSQDGKTITRSVASFGFSAAAYREADGSSDRASVLLGVAFIGLLVVVVAALAALRTIGSRSGRLRSPWWVGIVATLLVLGVLGVWLTVAVGSGPREVHQGPFWLTAGAIILALLAGSRTAQSLWVQPT